MKRLDGKVAMITGCRRGFGLAIAELFASEGASIAICDIVPLEELKRKVESEITDKGGKVLSFQTDVSDEVQVNSMVEETIQEFGTIDILVNNVGIKGPTKNTWDLTLHEWNKTIAVNLGSTFLCTKAVIPTMIEKKYGRIINFSSTIVKKPYPYRTPYATTKMGIIGFTRVLAVEVGRHNITVNTICPGNPGGERNIEVLKDLAKYLGRPFDIGETIDKFKKMREKGVLGGKFLENEGYVETLISHQDVAQLALFLVSDEAGSITGQDINVSAGVVMW